MRRLRITTTWDGTPADRLAAERTAAPRVAERLPAVRRVALDWCPPPRAARKWTAEQVTEIIAGLPDAPHAVRMGPAP